MIKATPRRWEELIKANQIDFKKDRFDILVATKGFGMGIDKSSVRFIVHTSLSSGLESWYQEVGRAGRDDQRAHIVLLCEPPHPDCRKRLSESGFRPDCNYRAGCLFGKKNLCDYGKQHMFISRSYPGAESDAMAALRMLDKLFIARQLSHDDSVGVTSSNAYISRNELALYRLMVLGFVNDYVVTYGRNVRFDVDLLVPEPSDAAVLPQMNKRFQGQLAAYLEHFRNSGVAGAETLNETISHGLERCRQEYRGPDDKKLDSLSVYSRAPDLYRSAYYHLLLLLDHTYKEVVTMRYEMLWNLLAVVATPKCRRLEILGYFGESVEEDYRCGMCDVCAPGLNFPETRNPPVAASKTEKKLLLRRILEEELFDLPMLRAIVSDFKDYPTTTYRQVRSVLEGNPSNLPALFLAREFSPSEEFVGNAKRLLRTANQRYLPFPDIEALYQTSPNQLKSHLLLLLNEADSACDSIEGWRFLADEAARPEHRQSGEVRMMGECLEFFHFVESAAAEESHSLKDKARRLAEAFRA